jgi:hypothetical protein
LQSKRFRVDERIQHSLANHPGFVLRHVREDDDELVVAHPSNVVGLAHDVTEAVRDRHEQLVTDLMAEDVVDLLEVVEVDPEDRHAAAAVVECSIQALAEHRPIGQLGERIVESPICQLGLQPLLLQRELL